MGLKSLYIHIPFCAQKCLYCDFVSFAGKESRINDYIKSLDRELSHYRNEVFDTVYIGGGTPTFLNADNLRELGHSISKLKLTKDVEFSVEANPGTLSREKLHILKGMGVNRLSIGLQSCNDNLLNLLGRIHTMEEFTQSYEMAKEAGFENINIDVMFGLPTQTFEDFRETIKKVIELNPTHISCYSLIVEENTPFYSKYRDGISLPEEDAEREMYEYAVKELKANGYEHYEISNFAKKNRQCQHNLAYWSMKEYIGCGLNASSYVKNKRIENTKDMDLYIEMCNKGEKPIGTCHENSIKDNMEEYIFTGLRKTNGISKSEFQARYNKSIYDVYNKVINKYVSMGYLEDVGDYLKLSFQGLQVSNVIMADFI
ncbi:coproporphyrinogen III oxidase, anaerobic [Hathewaya proteolytica DSM 3090]|uniref:Heme chaperone HemW n=1 Tax=Hathewaya proteolytica DSM 3090 TaxID=1121331 RepID=A0A1M6JHF4_9CLOT|nr:radical SAM family heme chaperone HemW [Hathewaya proteolytica]SHJ46114.1 coproporphyrinogen III oxidase, anaerobic [Hathewaya proteolytica DSM 3090]